MRILIDTHAWLWSTLTPHRLSPRASSLIEASEHDCYLSAVSSWEIAIKHATGKLRLPEAPATYVPARLARMRILSLPIEQHHALHVSTLPMHHRDPFDRLLIAQAQLEHLQILTADPVFAAYDVKTIAAS